MKIVYLHGFASSPQSGKAQFLVQKLAEQGKADLLAVPDLNLGDFSRVTITKMLNFLQLEFSKQPLLVIGSSLGGFVAVQWAMRNPLVQFLLLLAPALNFPTALGEWLGEAGIKAWQEQGDRPFFHYGNQQHVSLHYEFYRDAQQYANWRWERNLPIVILHGKRDVVVPPQVSIDFSAQHQGVELHLLDSDHSLSDQASLELLWHQLEMAMVQGNYAQ